MASSLFGELDRSLHERLGDLIRQAENGDDTTNRRLAMVEVPRMVIALHALLDEHHPDDDGRCLTCRRGRFGRRPPGPCRAYLAAHLCLSITQDDASHADVIEHRFERAS
jgi:hypothetical protein